MNQPREKRKRSLRSIWSVPGISLKAVLGEKVNEMGHKIGNQAANGERQDPGHNNLACQTPTYCREPLNRPDSHNRCADRMHGAEGDPQARRCLDHHGGGRLCREAVDRIQLG